MTSVDAADINLDAAVRLRRLTFLDEGDEVTVGRPDNDTYVHLPADGAALLRRLVEGDSPSAAAAWYAERYGETVDMRDFLDTLAELEFLADEDADEFAAEEPLRWRWLAKALLSPVAFVCYGLITAAGMAVMIARPELAPHYEQAFYTSSLVAVMFTLFLGQFPFLLLHEWFHALAGWRLGLRSKLRISRRMYFIVFETSMDGLVSVPRRQRYLPILAGVMIDVVATAALTLIAAVTGGVLAGICLAIAFTNIMRVLWQCYFFLRTDLYYLVVTVLGCQNLHLTSRNLLRRRASRLIGLTPPPEVDASDIDRRAARWYSWLLLIGYAAMIFSLIYVVVPSIVYVAAEVVDRIAENAPTALIVDSLIVAVLVSGQFVLAAVIGLRNRSRARRTTAPTPQPKG
ncbi:hypothetical protein [Stackebrandtia soli]|uniref:hypothetical protein n=1 Tax=Stackebrandtia soli TaxID=1892856 RepID=UPI0039EA6E77